MDEGVQKDLHEEKCEQSSPGFELWSPIPYPMLSAPLVSTKDFPIRNQLRYVKYLRNSFNNYNLVRYKARKKELSVRIELTRCGLLDKPFNNYTMRCVGYIGICIRHLVRIKLTRCGLLVKPFNNYTTRCVVYIGTCIMHLVRIKLTIQLWLVC